MSLRESNRQRVRATILEVCEGLFRARGFDQTAIDDIAAGAGISRQTFFNYFSGKDAVLAELGLEWLRRQSTLPRIDPNAPAAPSVLAEARRVVRAQARAIEADRDFMRLVITRAGLSGHRERSAAEEPGPADPVRAIFTGVAEVIRAGQAAGEIRAGLDPMRAAEAYVSTMLMTVRLWLLGYWDGDDRLEARIDAAIDVIEGGLRQTTGERG